MGMRNFDYFAVNTVNEALDFLTKHKDRCVLLAGGTDIIVKLKDGILHPEVVLDITRIGELNFIREDNEKIYVGPLVTHTELLESSIIHNSAPALHQALSQLGSPLIRNIATIGGNVVTASPVADSVPPLFTLSAELMLLSAEGKKRVISIDKFGIGPQKSVIEPDELLIEIAFRKVKPGEISFFRKLGQRKSLAISKVSCAFWGAFEDDKFSDVSVALGAVAPKVIRAEKTAEYLVGKAPTFEVIKEAGEIARSEATPITDVRSTEYYRKCMAGNLLVKGLAEILGIKLPA